MTGKELNKLISDLGLTKQKFADLAGVSRKTVYNWIDAEDLDYPTILQIEDARKKIELDGFVKDLHKKSNISRSFSKEEFDTQIKLVPVHAQAGYLPGHTQEKFVNELPNYYANTHEPGVYRAFEVKGDSMETEIMERDQLLCKYLDKAFWPDLHKGGLFVFVHQDDGAVIKQVKKQIGGVVTLHSFNSFYPDYEINLSEVLEIWYWTKEMKTFRDFRHKIYE